MIHTLFTRLITAILLGLIAVAAHAQTPAETRQVTPETLRSELAAATAGTVLQLSPGTYGVLELRGLAGAAGAPITLISAYPDNRAVLTGLELRQVRHIVLDNIVFDYTFDSEHARHLRPFQVLSSVDVTITNSLFDGDVARGVSETDDGFGTAFGFGLRDTDGFTFEGNEVRNFFRGTVMSQSRNLVVRDNDLHDIRMDGMNFAEVVDVVIEGNHIHDFNRSIASTDHADMIQFWTNRTDSPSRNIVIRNNVLNSGAGWFTQSIFMRNDMVDRGLAGDEMFYRNILIEENVILNAHLHGITVGETDGLIIRNNTVVRNATSEGPRDNPNLYVPQIRVGEASRDVTVARNVVSRIVGHTGQAGWQVTDNLFVQDRTRLEAGFYGLIFSPLALEDPRRIDGFVPLPGGPLDGAGIGATRLSGD